MKKRILVTGGAGYIGSHTVHELVKQGYHVKVFDSLEKGHKESLKGKVCLVEGNLSDTNLIEETIKNFKPDAVMHFAGYTEVGESMKKPQKYYENNLINGINLVKAMLGNNVNKIIYSSTASVYGQPKSMPISEDDDKTPTNNYGISKLLFERYLDSCKGLNSICLRYFNAAGAGYGIGEDHDPETHLIPIVLKTALGQQDQVKVYGANYATRDGTAVRDYIHVLDLAEAHILALDVVEHNKSRKYNLGSGKGYSVAEVISKVKQVTGKEVPVALSKRRPGDPAVLIASSKKIKKELGWQPKRGLKEIIESAWEWHSKNPKGF